MEIDHTFSFPLTYKGKVVKCTLITYEKVCEVLFDDELVTELHQDINGWTDQQAGKLPDDVINVIREKIEKNWV